MLRAHWSFAVAFGLVVSSFLGCASEEGPPATSSTTTTNADTSAIIDAPRYAAPSTAGSADPSSNEIGASIEGATTTASTPHPSAAPVPASAAPAGGAEPADRFGSVLPERMPQQGIGPGQGGDKYSHIEESGFLTAKDTPLSTFSIDVDTASYSKMRSYLMEHHTMPPPDAVRIEELVNYFSYDYAAPTDEHPFAVHVETADCPWQGKHRLVRFGIQGKRIDEDRPVSNLVFLIDVSGSMSAPNKLPLVQRSLSMLVRQLGENDRVAIVVYAGAAGMVLPSTSGTEQREILAAIEKLRAGGSTNGGEGIFLAYKTAEENLVKGGVNRVILCSDGDFNVGTTSTGDLVRLATEKSKAGIYLSVLGFGTGNHNDAMMEELSNKANGNYAFIDSDAEARKVLVEQMQGTIVTIAKDVKIQVEFNPAQVSAYRLIGYENRRLADRDFNDDTKDAGDIGAGHSVTALYEVVPVGIKSDLGQPQVDPLKYQPTRGADAKVEAGAETSEESDGEHATESKPDISGELLTLKLRYQPPTGGKSTVMTFPVKDSGAKFGSSSPDFQFAASVVSFGMMLRNSSFKGDTSYAAIFETAAAARGEDKNGLRSEFLELVRAAAKLNGVQIAAASPLPVTRSARYRPASYEVASGASHSGSAPDFTYLHRFRPEHVLILGIAAGVAVSFLALLFCLGLAYFRKGSAVLPLPGKPSGKTGLWV